MTAHIVTLILEDVGQIRVQTELLVGQPMGTLLTLVFAQMVSIEY